MRDASPRTISRRTRYLRVRLAFRLYPQLIPQLFNVEEFGPPRSITSASAWPWVAHAVSGLVHATTDLLGPRPIQTRFRFGSGRQSLTSPHTANSPDHSSIGTPSRYCLRSNTLRLLVGTWFQFLFHSPPGVLFTFPSRYLFTIGHQVVFSLARWSGQILTEFHVLRDT